MRRLLRNDVGQEFLQWFGLLGAPLAWSVQHVVGYGVTEARCSPGSAPWGLSVDAWELSLTLAAVAVILLAELAAVSLYFATRGVHYDGAPPVARRHFFVTASSLGNLLFLGIVLMSGLAAVYHIPCGQS